MGRASGIFIHLLRAEGGQEGGQEGRSQTWSRHPHFFALLTTRSRHPHFFAVLPSLPRMHQGFPPCSRFIKVKR